MCTNMMTPANTSLLLSMWKLLHVYTHKLWSWKQLSGSGALRHDLMGSRTYLELELSAGFFHWKYWSCSGYLLVGTCDGRYFSVRIKSLYLHGMYIVILSQSYVLISPFLPKKHTSHLCAIAAAATAFKHYIWIIHVVPRNLSCQFHAGVCYLEL